MVEHGRNGDEKSTAEGLLRSWTKFENVFLLMVFLEIFSLTTPLSESLQTEQMTISIALNLAQSTIAEMTRKRDDEHFESLWSQTSEFMAERNLSSEPAHRPQRHRKPSSRLLDTYLLETVGRRDEPDGNNPKLHCKQSVYYQIYDKVLSELRQRFEQPRGILLALDACHPNSTDFLNETKLKCLADEYSIDVHNLKAEISVIRPLVKDLNNITSVLNKIKSMKEGFPSLWQLLHLAVTLPVANVKCERSFSVLKLVKTYLRSTMGQIRLTSLGILSIEKEVVNDLNLDEVVDRFAVMPIKDSDEQTGNVQRRLQLVL